MENHPIPQDVTGFQFKLIGTMTVKQFGYVASGVVMAVILYYLPLNSAFGILFKVIVIPILGASGAIIAFVPIDGRPIDIMATNFIKAVFSPNQYIYHRAGRHLSFTTISIAKIPVEKKNQQKTQPKASTETKQLEEKEAKLRALLLNSRERVKSDIDKKEAAFLQTLTIPNAPSTTGLQAQHQPLTTTKPSPPFTNAIRQNNPIVNVTPPITPQIQATHIPQPSIPPKLPTELPKREETHAATTEQPNKIAEPHTETQQQMTLLSKQVQEIHAQKQQLEKELSNLQQQLANQKGVAPTPQKALQGQPLQDPQHVRVIPQDVSKKAGLPHVSDSPNVVIGIVKDPRGNILPNILVEVKDKDGNPVRAFKTNQLGHFASATPLSPGTYTIELEDPKKLQRFSVIQITANNQILLPIEIISHDAREELRRELFAN